MKILLVVGTRPELIKLAPIWHAAAAVGLEAVWCFTGQHPKLSTSGLAEDLRVTDFPSYHAGNSTPDLALYVQRIRAAIAAHSPDWVIVQGDTTSALCGAIVAHGAKCRIAHVEAGLRSKDLSSPHPEEGHRRMISAVTTMHFAPTSEDADNLLATGVPFQNIAVVGNTVIDSLVAVGLPARPNPKELRADGRVLVTAHRHENRGEPMDRIAQAITAALPTTCFAEWVAHPNPAVGAGVDWAKYHRIDRVPPLAYRAFLHRLNSAMCLVTDSGGAQEEATYLGVPTVVCRQATERALAPGSVLVDPHGDLAVMTDAIRDVIRHGPRRNATHQNKYHYGDGTAGQRICEVLAEQC